VDDDEAAGVEGVDLDDEFFAEQVEEVRLEVYVLEVVVAGERRVPVRDASEQLRAVLAQQQLAVAVLVRGDLVRGEQVDQDLQDYVFLGSPRLRGTRG